MEQHFSLIRPSPQSSPTKIFNPNIKPSKMSDKKRESGYYWVKYNNAWHIAKWNEILSYWKILDTRHHYHDKYFTEITSQKLNPPHES